MNWNYLRPRLAVAFSLWAFFAFGFDPLLRRGLIVTGEGALGGKVDVVSARTTFRGPSVELAGVRVGDRAKPEANLVEFNRLHLRFAGAPLLRKKFVVDEATLEGLRWNTPRADSGAVSDWKPVWKRFDGDLFDGLDLEIDLPLDDAAKKLGRDALDEFMKRARESADPNRLESYRVASELEDEWPKRFDDLTARIGKIEQRGRAIERDAGSIRGSTLERVDGYARLARDARSLVAEVDQVRVDLQVLPHTARNDFKRLQTARDNDLRMLRESIAAAPVDATGLSELLLGRSLRQQVERLTILAGRVHKVMSNTPTDWEPVRMRGVDIPFPERDPTPRCLVKSLRLAGEASLDGRPFPFHGTVNDVSTDPRLHAKPTTVRLEAVGPTTATFVATFDRTSEIPHDTLELAWEAPETTVYELGLRDSLALRAAADRTTCRARVERNRGTLVGSVRWNLSEARVALLDDSGPTPTEAARKREPIRTVSLQGTTLKPPASLQTPAELLGPDDASSAADSPTGAAPADESNLWNEVLAQALAGVDSIEAQLNFSRAPGGDVEMSIRSDLGHRVADGLKAGLVDAIDRRRQQTLARLESDLRKRSNDLRTLMARRYDETLAEIDARDADLKSLIDRMASGKPLDLGAIKPVKAIRDSKALGEVERLMHGETPKDPKDLEQVRQNVRDLRNEFKVLRDARGALRK